MSWRDDPIVEAPKETPQANPQAQDWQNDPIVEPPEKETSWMDVPSNAVKDVGGMIKGGAALTKNLVDPGNIVESAASGSLEPTKEKLSQDWETLKGIPGSLVNEAKQTVQHPIETFKQHPVNTALNVAGVVAPALKGLGGAAEAGEVGKAAEVGGEAAKVSEAIPKAPGYLKKLGNRLESNVTAGALDLNSRGINRIVEGLDNPETAMNHINKKLNELFPNFIDLTDTAGSKYDKLLSAHNQASDVIGQVIDAITGKEGGMPEVDSAIDKLTQASAKFNGKTSTKNLEAFNELNDAKSTLQGLKDSGQLNFKNLYEVKKGIGEAFDNPRYDNPGVDKAYGIVSDAIDGILDRTTSPNPAQKEMFNHAKDIFSFTSDLLPAMKRGVTREIAGVGGGITNAGLATAGVMGHPAAWPALAGKTAAKVMAPDFGKNLVYKGMNALKSAPNVIPTAGGMSKAALAAFLARQNQKKSLPDDISSYVNSRRNP